MRGRRAPSNRRFTRRKTTPKVRDGIVQRKNPWDAEHTTAPAPLVIRTEVPRYPYRHVLTEQDIRDFISLLPEWDELSRGLEEILLADRDEDATDGWYCDGTVTVCAWHEKLVDVWPEQHYEEHRALLERLGVPADPELVHFCSVRGNYAAPLDAGQLSPMWKHVPDDDEDFRIDVVTSGREWNLRNKHGNVEYKIVSNETGVDVYDICRSCRFTEPTVRAYLLLHIFLHELGHHRDSVTTPCKGWTVRGEDFAEQYAFKYEKKIWDDYFRMNPPRP